MGLGSLLGGSSSNQSQSSTFINKDQLPYLQSLWGAGSGIMQQQMQGGMMGQANQMAGQLYGQGQGFLNQLQGPYQMSQGAQSQIGSLQQQLGQQSERMMAGVGQQGVGTGQFGSSRGEIGKGMVAEGAQNVLAQGAGQIMGQDQAIQAQSALGGLSSLQGLYGLGMSPYQSQWGPAAAMAGILGGPAMESQSTGRGRSQGGIGSSLGGLAEMGGLASVAFSDRRLKTNIVHIGTTPGGHNVYEYDYIWGGGKQRGVLAQEVPHAAIMMPNGYLAVDYSRIA
ncbi:MAG: tail fiber domain-containing protein [Gammaproteobacteria bacterium]|nr:tail fiber domain-containing protein [Gammaproteobacteria bacterium]MCP4091551.1 tail fiber domain-containing protein [Gammaproteobacteria bacterium]MCP4929389.1 tail fiber domain-containing protein [Gammaproteobacteria bacterium]